MTGDVTDAGTGTGTGTGVRVTAPASDDRRARAALARLVEPGLWSLHAAVADHGAVAVCEALLAGRPLAGLSAELRAGVASRAQGWSGDTDERLLLAAGARLVVPGDVEWPAHRLSWSRQPGRPQLSAPPLSLCLRGTGALGEVFERSVAVIGARAATAYGQHVATELSLGLADRGWTVVSGGAYGIDGAAHRGALTSEQGRTAAVLACGVDVAYPRGHDRLLARVAQRGLLVSEHLPGTTPTRGRFLVRNRLIAALSVGTVVVEAAARSGSLSTAHRAFDLVREVMAVPGPVTSTMSTGCHALVRGTPAATLVTGVGEVLDLVGPVGEDPATPPRGPRRVHDDLPAVVLQVLEAVPVRGGAGEASIAKAAGVAVLVAQQVLPPLLVAGLVARSDTGWVLTPLGAGRPAGR